MVSRANRRGTADAWSPDDRAFGMADAESAPEGDPVSDERVRRAHPVWIVEDEPTVGTLAAEICEAVGALPTVFRAPLPYLLALRGSSMPSAVILDWRLENELSSGLFLATRHRYTGMPVIYWTNSPRDLPAMIRDDRLTLVVDKQGGVASLERALAWAFSQGRPSYAEPAEPA